MTQMINDYKSKLQSKLTASLVHERNGLTEHLRSLVDLKSQSLQIKKSLTDLVDSELKIIHENESEYHKL